MSQPCDLHLTVPVEPRLAMPADLHLTTRRHVDLMRLVGTGCMPAVTR